MRIAALAGGLGLGYGMAALLPGGHEALVGVVAFAAVVIATFWWSSRDSGVLDLDEVLRDWLVVAFTVAVFWWVTLSLFEGATDVMNQLKIEFLSVLATGGLIFAVAGLGIGFARRND